MRICEFTGFVLVVLGLAGCSKPESRVAQGNREQILHLGNVAEPATLDPALWTSTYEWHVMSALFEPLVDYDAATGMPIARAAERWEVSEGGAVYTFHLRPNGRWSNGDPVTAADFVYAYQRSLRPRLGAQQADRLFVLRNAREYYDGKLKDPAQIGCVALGDYTLRLTLREPIAYHLGSLLLPHWYPVHRGTVERFGAIDDRDSLWAREGNLVGNGPFTLKDWKMNHVIRVEKNPHYWGAETVRLRAVCFYPIDSAATEERAFRSGQLHVTYNLPPEKVASYQREAQGQLRIDPGLNVYYLPLNVSKPPLNDARVRRALALAVDRGQLVERIAGPGYRPARHFSIPGAGGYTSPIGLTESVPEARKLLAAAGYPEGRGIPTLKFTFNTSDLHRPVAEALQEMWRVNLGISVELVNSEFKVHLATLYARDFDLARIGYGAEFADPLACLLQMTTGAKDNFPGWSHPEYDRLIRLAVGELNAEKRFALCQQAESILLEEMPLIPIFFDPKRYLVQDSVKGWQPGLLENYPYTHAYLEAP